MLDNKLAEDEANRIAALEAMKTGIKTEVGAEIAAESQRPTADEAQQIASVARSARQMAVNEVVDTGNEVERGRFFARVSQIVDYVFFVIYGLLGIRLLLALFAANNSAGFVQMIKRLTDPFYAPFKGIVPSLQAEGGFTLALPIVVALVVYMLIHFGINGLLRMFVHRKTAV